MGIAGLVSAMSTRPPTRRWPALWTALALGLGIIADDTLVAGPAVWAGIAGCAWLTAATLLFRRRPRLTSGLLLLVVFGAGGLRHHQATRLSPPHHVRYLSAWVESGLLIGRIVAAGGRRRSSSHRSSAGHSPSTGRNRGRWRSAATALRQSHAQQGRNPRAFDYRRFLALQGIHATASVANAADVEVEAHPNAWWRRQIINPVHKGGLS
jgi:hypothetical protein